MLRASLAAADAAWASGACLGVVWGRPPERNRRVPTWLQLQPEVTLWAPHSTSEIPTADHPEDPLPGRHDAHAARLANAEQARRIAASQRLAGSHDESARSRTFLTEEFDSIVRRDAVGRLVVDWSRAGPQPHDSAGRFIVARGQTAE